MAKEYFDPVRYDFTRDEIRALGQQLARDVQKLLALRDEKKAHGEVLGMQIKAVEKEISKLSQKISSGFELREPETMTLQFEPEER